MSRNALALGIVAAPFVTVATLFFGAPAASATSATTIVSYQSQQDPQFRNGNATAPTPRGSAGGCSSAGMPGCTAFQDRVYGLHGR